MGINEVNEIMGFRLIPIINNCFALFPIINPGASCWHACWLMARFDGSLHRKKPAGTPAKPNIDADARCPPRTLLRAPSTRTPRTRPRRPLLFRPSGGLADALRYLHSTARTPPSPANAAFLANAYSPAFAIETRVAVDQLTAATTELASQASPAADTNPGLRVASSPTHYYLNVMRFR